MIQVDEQLGLAPGDSDGHAGPGNGTAAPLGRLIAVSGSQVTVQFTSDLSPDGADSQVTVGCLLGINTGGALAIGALSDIRLENSANDQGGSHAIGQIDLLGEIAHDASGAKRFDPGVTVYPRLGSIVVSIGVDELRVIFDLSNPHTIELGRLQQSGAMPACVNVDEIVQKHFAIVGSTGSGKSTALALILRQIIDVRSDLRVLLIDAHNEYAGCFEERAHVAGPGNLRLPFWLLSFDELVHILFGPRSGADREITLLAELIPAAKTEYARSKSALRSSYRTTSADGGRYTADTPVPYRFEDVIALAESRMGKLENSDVAIQYQRLLMRINAVRKNLRYAFIFEDGGDVKEFDGGDLI